MSSADVSRHLCRGNVACRSTARSGVDFTRASKHQGNREALCSLGSRTAGAAGEQRAASLGQESDSAPLGQNHANRSFSLTSEWSKRSARRAHERSPLQDFSIRSVPDADSLQLPFPTRIFGGVCETLTSSQSERR